MKKELKKDSDAQRAMFGMGCFWGVQALFDSVPGVLKTTVGYTGGAMKDPSYDDVCSDSTGHAEAIEIEFDSKKLSYDNLLDVFWNNHNPTTSNRQGPDFGSQYRSVIFYFNEEQKKKAEMSKNKMQKKLGERKIVTEIVPAKKFYPAEEYHQKYLQKKGLASCHI